MRLQDISFDLEDMKMRCRELVFKTPMPSEALRLTPYFRLRPNKTCDSGWLDTFIWADFYKIRVAEADGKALLMLMQDGDEYFGAMPYCVEEDLAEYFVLLQTYFNEVLGKPFKIYLADEEAVASLELESNGGYIVREEEDFRDYLYDGDALRSLAGKKLQKKRNLVHKFEHEYEGRWEYRSLDCTGRQELIPFLENWYEARLAEEQDAREELIFEKNGLFRILDECSKLPYHIGAIFIDGQIRAVSIGAFNPLENMACVSVEKGDPDIVGIYQVINQQFLIHEFPNVAIVNREDDMGLPGLRQSKMSYYPSAFERKFMVLQKAEGYRDELVDNYEKTIHDREHE